MKRKGIMILDREALNDLTRIFCQTLFGGIPQPPIMFEDDLDGLEEEYEDDMEAGEDDKSLGRFVVKKSKKYSIENDIYREESGRKRFKKYGFGIYEEITCIPDTWAEPSNNPYHKIVIREILRFIMTKEQLHIFLSVLLHELVHYYCWYCGYGWRDGSADFEKVCRNLDIPTNYPPYCILKDGKYTDTYDYRKMERFVKIISYAKIREAAGKSILGYVKWKNTP